ncbi:hypothetical protein AHiyo4_26590 [Arthrobacter sp. Hiyo4]|nr:hypothetical protein AHiyo4_26590 [Arthrobacter sp. Hiyo4]
MAGPADAHAAAVAGSILWALIYATVGLAAEEAWPGAAEQEEAGNADRVG